MEYDDIVYGRNSVLELLKSGKDINKLFVEKGNRNGSINEIIAKAKQAHIVVVEVDKRKLDTMANNHQGVVAVVPPFEYSDIYDSEDYDFSNVDEIKQAIMSGELYSELVFKSNNVTNINNIYIASKINSYDDFKNIKQHKYILFDFLNSESIKTIEVGELVEKALIYFKTRDISLIRKKNKNHEYRLEQIKHNNIEELVPDGEDDIDNYGFRYYRYIINPNAF